GKVRRHLAPGGRFVFGVFNSKIAYLNRDPAKRIPEREYEDPEGKGNDHRRTDFSLRRCGAGDSHPLVPQPGRGERLSGRGTEFALLLFPGTGSSGASVRFSHRSEIRKF